MSSDTFMGVMGKETAIWDSFQQAYERVMDNESRWINLVKLVYYRIVGILMVYIFFILIRSIEIIIFLA